MSASGGVFKPGITDNMSPGIKTDSAGPYEVFTFCILTVAVLLSFCIFQCFFLFL